MDPLIFKEAAKITLGLELAYLWTIIYQVIVKIKTMSDFKIKKIKDSKLKFNRYDSQDMLAVDRSIGNFNEWKVSFLALFWINAYLNGTDLWYGWIYVFIRVIYPILAHFFNGITAKGVAPQMFISTVPGYFVLIVYGVRIANAVF